uniref:Uncharacterized protein n=1 Tax=Kalanchoe fedtschenkoi TaxID=63787 RepID=A0A7N0TL63_KALFE
MRRADTSFRMLPLNSSPSLTLARRFGFKREALSLRISAASSDPPSTARFKARRRESILVQQLQKPLSEFMSLPISYDSVLAGEKVEKLDDNTFKCHVYRFNVFTYQICPVLLVRVDHQPNGCRINLLSCKLEGSPSVAAQSDNFETSMVNQISCETIPGDSSSQILTSDTVIEVCMKLPSTFISMPVKTIESAGTKVLEKVLMVMLPRFMAQVAG